MEMKTEANELIAFHLTGERPKAAGNDPAKLNMCPALLSGYRDLTKLRYDYPLALIDDGSDRPLKPLSGIFNEILQVKAPRGISGERMRKTLLSLEREIRAVAVGERPGSLSELWSKAADNLLSQKGLSSERKRELEEDLAAARSVLHAETGSAQVVCCDENAAATIIAHTWRMIREKRDLRARRELREVIVKLSDILKNDYMRSNEARRPGALEATVGGSFQGELDFEVMSKTLPEVREEDLLPKKRRERVEFAISVLESQRFFGLGRDKGGHSFEAESCTEALGQFRKRLPEMVDFVKAIRIAELEIANAYRAESHDRFFERFDEDSLSAEDVGLFPSYLVWMSDERYDDANKAALVEILSSDLPIKIFFQTGEVFKRCSITNGAGAFSGWNLGLANMAMSLGAAFVLQTTSSNLYQVSRSISEGMTYQGSALFSVFSGSEAKNPNLPLYLVSASAMQSRAFPTLVYRPQNGNDWASRFSVDANPQPERIWPVTGFSYQDENAQSMSEELVFTLVDYLATDSRFADGFLSVPRSAWCEQMIPLGAYLQDDPVKNRGKVPYILMVGEDNALHRVIVSRAVTEAAKRYARSWRNLQELGGIGNSHALKLLDEERRIWEEEKQKEIDGLLGQPVDQGPADAAQAPADAEGAAEVEEVSSDVAYIETVRCSTCNECTNRNGKMFMYNENKQAYIADLEAGTYRELVEAAEVCQLAIIHPGKPWNPDEPNLEELIKRAQPFL
jgi:hypothetical protein